ncbi:MAG: NADH-quinone oxidoreductase subunit M [Calditrichia bacterium]
MTLTFLYLWFVIGGILAWISGRWSKNFPRWISLGFLSIHMAVLIIIWIKYLAAQSAGIQSGPWIMEINVPWIARFGIHYSLALDGFSLLLIVLSNFLGIMAVAASWEGIQYRIGFFHFNLLWILAAIVGIFLAMDLFLFYFFWEIMLVPLYFLIGIWGHENRTYATLKFFIFTQASGLFMLLAILGLYFVHGASTGIYTFNYTDLLGTPMSGTTAFWLMLGFFIAFGVKLPLVPVHTWLPDAHTEAPTAGSVDLAGLVLKVGAYGFIRFMIPLFPEASFSFAPVAMILSVVGIIYGAVVAFGQTDLKRLVAYTSISHMGFVLLGAFAWNQLALQGALIIMLSHGLSTGALFILVGDLQDRIHTREMGKMGGLWDTMPRMGGYAMFFSMASLGLPGIGNFVGEILVLFGVYQVSVTLGIIATIGFIVATIYSLWIIQRAFWGKNTQSWKLHDHNPREVAIMVIMVVGLMWMGLYPQTILNTSRQAFKNMRQYVYNVFQPYHQKSSAYQVNPARDEMTEKSLNTAQIKPKDGDQK